MSQNYIEKILRAKVYDVAIETPLDFAPSLSERLANRVFLKREDLQSVFSFKLRGAYNKMSLLDESSRAKGVIAASAGNHAQGVALAAKRLDINALIIMPTTTPEIKINSVTWVPTLFCLAIPTAKHMLMHWNWPHKTAGCLFILMTIWMLLPDKALSQWKSSGNTPGI